MRFFPNTDRWRILSVFTPFATLHVTFSLFGMKIFSQSNVTCPEKEISIICDQFVITGFSLFDKLEGLNLD